MYRCEGPVDYFNNSYMYVLFGSRPSKLIKRETTESWSN